MRTIFYLFLFSIPFFACQRVVNRPDKIDLNGSWQFQRQGDSVWFLANVPGVVQADLYTNKQI